MCMEDIKIGRASGSEFKTFGVIPGTATLIASPNPNRVALTVAGDTTDTFFVGPNPIVNSTGGGFCLTPQNPTITFRIEDMGSLMRQAWFCASQGGAGGIFLVDTILERQT